MDYIQNLPHIKYEGLDSDNIFAYKHYNAQEVIGNKTMEEHLKFSMAYWHTMTYKGSDPFGENTFDKPYEVGSELEVAKKRVEVFFELLNKLNIKYFCFHDVDIAPQGQSLSEFFENLDIITDLFLENMHKYNKKLLWNTANLFTHKRYMHGGATSCNADVFAIAAAQVKKSLDINKKLNGESYVFWGGREGYDSLLNTDMHFELENLAYFYHLAIDYSKQINHTPQFLIEPKPKEPSKHQYDFDAATAYAFLQKYQLTDYFKLNLEANHATLAGHTFEHELHYARINQMLGSIDANQGDLLLGWDTDEFPTDLYSSILAMYEVIENQGLEKGGINFDSKARRNSNTLEDIALAHIAGIDTYARAFKIAMQLKQDQFFEKILKDKYASFESGIGKSIVERQTTLEELTQYALTNKETENKSARIELIKNNLNNYLK